MHIHSPAWSASMPNTTHPATASFRPGRCDVCVRKPSPRHIPHRPDSWIAMTLTQLRYLVAIADCRLNITAAAEHVHATQPGVSKQLKQLEDELGLQLFIRKGKSLDTITDAGVRVIERARLILAEALNIRSIA